MTLTILIVRVAIAALILTLIVGLVLKKQKNWIISYLQNFTGALFLFSGWVKAVDPLGTAYKMEQYFGEFQSTFEGTAMSFIAPLFPALSEYAVGFSVFMIVFEIVLGLMLILGTWPKLTSWAFFLLVAFFTVLTGFTYLTGYVPNDVNFFEFGKWGDYVETNMKVTDCGCFGDFLKLKPKVSFFKDIFLMIPAIIFLLANKQFHQLFSNGMRSLLPIASIVGLLIYCFSNYVWDLPHADFRPFKVNTDVAAQRAIEEEAMGNVKVTGYTVTNKETGEQVEIAMENYGKEYKNYPKEQWGFEQIRTKPSIEPTKISEFAVEHGTEGYEITDDILQGKGYAFMIVAVDLNAEEGTPITTVRRDTTYTIDTLEVNGVKEAIRRMTAVNEVPSTEATYTWSDSYKARWTEVVNPVMEQASKEGIKVYSVTKYTPPSKIKKFQQVTGSNYPFHLADDILLKTIIRSNPGVVLWKDGAIVGKWHHKKLPNFEEIKSEYIK